MKKTFLASLLIALSSTSVMAEARPYIGISFNSFSINTTEITVTDGFGFSNTSTGDARDSGTAAGISGGIMLDDNGKINIAYFSGDEDDSEFLTTTVTSISYDYSFNNSGYRRGWFLGGGFSSVEIEAERTSFSTAGVAKASGALFRGGYEYLLDNSLFVEIGFNAHFAEVDLKFDGSGFASGLELESKMDVSNLYISLSYVF